MFLRLLHTQDVESIPRGDCESKMRTIMESGDSFSLPEGHVRDVVQEAVLSVDEQEVDQLLLPGPSWMNQLQLAVEQLHFCITLASACKSR